MAMGAAGDASHELRSSLTAVRLLVDGWRDGVVDARPGTRDGEQLHRHVRVLSDLFEGLPADSDRPATTL